MEKTPKRKKNSDGSDFDSFQQKRTKQEDLEVTGVSRSGRVRKKSSKLMDFESPDEIDSRYKRRNERSDSTPISSVTVSSHHAVGSGRGRKPQLHTNSSGAAAAAEALGGSPVEKSRELTIKMESHSEMSEEEMPDEYSSKQEDLESSESDLDLGMYQPPDVADDDSSMDSMGMSDVDDDDLDDDSLMMDDRADSNRRRESLPSQAQSLYMLEKSSKKKLVIRDGKIVGRMKAQRKDKGKTRFTAYMLWAKEIRQEILRVNPDMDFATMSKRLGELWATVPTNEKYNWKRRAKRLAVKGPQGSNLASIISMEAGKYKTPPSKSKFINKLGGRIPQQTSGVSASQTVTGSTHQQSFFQLGAPSVGNVTISPPTQTDSKPGKVGLVTEPMVGPGLYKVIGTQPVDVAAHLKLLGESLTIIGERLKEHEGQIAVSGSLSVLLDSLLCALGPLTCLTQQVPETNGCPQELLNKILDNIAYFMPGL
ncbi:HMG domain-containing protein 4 isoform X2 [Zootermopsis nevadensis]|uniref:HMG domain-containing protein 4 isoform X2 n=1 Tax=Zootermopsis nevadensis TaxID=136037 RepID=UPI000B8E5B54|nr:HMG domain-containing protein 4 isoform X2 [Zootermopsis nevadensis]